MNEVLDHPVQDGKTMPPTRAMIYLSTMWDSLITRRPYWKTLPLLQSRRSHRSGRTFRRRKDYCVRLASRFWDVNKGRITVGGMDISAVDPESLMSLYSIVFQDVTLFDNSIMENIRIGNKDATDEEVLAAAKL